MTSPGVVGYPAEARARYREAEIWRGRTLIEQWQEVADRRREADAVVAPQGRMTYGELSDRADRVAAGLLALGLVPGERVLFQVTNRIETVLSWYGVLKAGLVPVCTLAAHRQHEIAEIARRSGAAAHLVEAGLPTFDLVSFAQGIAADLPGMKALLTIGAEGTEPGVRIEDLAEAGALAEAREAVAEAQHGIEPEDVAVLQLSGGTTGTPKLIPRLHDEYWYNARRYAEVLGWDETVRVLHVLPIIHNGGVTCAMHAPHSVGGTAVLTPPLPEAFLPVLRAERITDMLIIGHALAPMVDQVIEQGNALRRIVLSGSKPPDGVFQAFDSAGVWVGQLFGMAEGMFLATPLNAPREAREFSVGVPISPLDEVMLLEPGSLTPVPDGTIGELCCRGPYTIRGYFDAEEHNRRAFTADGFYRTGDLAVATVRDGFRCYAVEGRIKDVIDRGGEKINCEEIEALLIDHPAIDLASIVAMPDPRLGERACAYVVSGRPVTLDDVRNYLADRGVAKFKWPERIEVVGALPRTAVGKIDKKALRADIAAKVAVEREVAR